MRMLINQQWEFIGGADDAWHWRLLDADTGLVISQSEPGFRCLFDCSQDAGLHGYGQSVVAEGNEAHGQLAGSDSPGLSDRGEP